MELAYGKQLNARAKGTSEKRRTRRMSAVFEPKGKFRTESRVSKKSSHQTLELKEQTNILS